MDCFVHHPNRLTELAKSIRRTKQVSCFQNPIRMCLTFSSASPLNGEAAELWDKDPAEFKRKVLGRHRDVDDE